ncbi:MAG: hypothetical protein C6P35_03095 [Cohnella sp.]|nr:MAG: hypothetical protein C6P35_03095 [Cohnella sp.]
MIHIMKKKAAVKANIRSVQMAGLAGSQKRYEKREVLVTARHGAWHFVFVILFVFFEKFRARPR